MAPSAPREGAGPAGSEPRAPADGRPSPATRPKAPSARRLVTWLALGLWVVVLALPAALLIGLRLGEGRVTPNDEFFTIAKGPPPEIDLAAWRLRVSGLVSRPRALSLTELAALPRRDLRVTLRCVDGPSATAVWSGVPLADILDQAGVEPAARAVVIRSTDGYMSSLPLAVVREYGALLADRMNGEPLPLEHGRPLRLVAPERQGYKWVKWIGAIEVVADPPLGTWEREGWDDDAALVSVAAWQNHAWLFSLLFLAGGLALVTGTHPGRRAGRLHRWSGQIFLWGALAVMAAWVVVVVLYRGAVLLGGWHGITAAVAVLALLVAAALRVPTRRGSRRVAALRTWLFTAGFLFYAAAVFTGLLLAFGVLP